MEGVFSTSVSEATLDESPMAYKTAEEILRLIDTAVEVIAMVRSKLNEKNKHE